ncbi:hypothetical protein IU433_26605 [Nocardia puris]|uniref:Uncharacterized protein n=1 Tax=Nocardia puris TaxID=208602 RepID=A0A366DJF8_9NOCA|nr:hypothetical protein [Nocardia puris]MBF6212963.1 hypothetical protein [Nocardia puris]MBF6367954.1 hypothetical protein [Nocardia puris]MBF6462587.1 hypothetical protein [Nocardia puris]RBO90210.1 hypothetical protein DFR74_10695 [Nocardia puris]
MKAVVGPADRVIAVGAGPAPRSTSRRRGKSAPITERRIIMGAALPTRRGVRVPRSCSAPRDPESQD